MERSAEARKPFEKGSSTFSISVLALIACCFMSLGITLLHGADFQSQHDFHVEQTFVEQHLQKLASHDHLVAAEQEEEGKTTTTTTRRHSSLPPLAGLDCSSWGGPSTKEALQEMVYWQDIPGDEGYVSPFKSKSMTQYMTFEPDGGGWNNIRMSMETVIAIAHATGRTLVLPPVQKMYLLGDSKAKQRNAFSFQDFYHMDRIANEHPGLDIISMDTFLERTKGQIHDVASGAVSFPPENRTDWNGLNDQVTDQLNPWLRTVALMPEWDPNKCLAAFPDSQEANSIADLHKDLQSILVNGKAPKPELSPLIDHPTPVDASSKDRMLEDLAGRNELCIYDETLQAAPLIHFHGKKGIGARLLVHFYAFLFFEDYKEDLWMKRFIRDHVRYIDELQCAAARIVEAVRDRARSRDKSNTKGEFDTFHIRRGDFQYKATRVDADELYDMSKDILTPGSTVYLATDERHKAFFQPLKDHYDIVFLDDYMHLIPGLNTNYYGMLDQLIATRGRFFFGCWFSTFTGFINRIRGYHSDKDKLPGYEKGVIESYYYALRKDKMAMRVYYPLKQAFYAREYPVSWRDLNHDVDEVLTAKSR